METRFGLWLGATALAGVAAVGFEASARPAAQVDIYAASPVRSTPAVFAAAADAGVTAAVAKLGPERSAALVVNAPGEAAAVEGVGVQILRQVAVEAVAPDRIRIRVASVDVDAARTVAREVGSAFGSHGLRERLRIESETTGGRFVLLARAVAALALAGLAVRLVLAGLRRLRWGWSFAAAAR